MMHRSFLLVTALLTSTILSAGANPLKSIEGLDEVLPHFKDYKSIPSRLTFQVEPSRTAAGVLHYAIDKKQGPVILLGIRDDDGTLCNLGGKSDEDRDSDKTKGKKAKKKKGTSVATLDRTASGEVEEESNQIYAHHPYTLKNLPFIDVLADRENKKSLLYRMYWKRVQKVEGEILFKALEESKQAHNKEYKGFLWVPVHKVLAALQNDEAIEVENGQSLDLYGPLLATLSTDSGLAFLESISEGTVLSRFNKALRPYLNRLYVIKNESDVENTSSEEEGLNELAPSEHATFKIHWHLPEVSKAQTETFTEKLSSGKTIKGYKVPVVPFGKNAWGEDKQKLTLNGLDPLDVPLSAEEEQSTFAYAVAAHGAAMVELKHKAPEILKKRGLTEDKIGSSQPQSIEGWNPHSDLALTRIHLRIVLGEDFKTANDFKDALNPQRAADIENLRKYLTVHSEVEYGQKDVKPEFKRQINFTDKDLEAFADMMDWEDQHKKFPAFYHGANADINNLWESFTHLRELLFLSPLVGQKIVMRGTDIYFRDVKTMADILKLYGTDDYAKGRASQLLCANYVLTAGLKTTRTSSSSIEYFLNNHSVNAPDIEEKFEEATALAGIMGHYPYFRSPFLQYLAHQDPTFENSVMVGVSVPPHLLSDHGYAAHGGGDPYKKFDAQGKENPLTVLDVLKGIQEEYETHKDKPEPFKERMEEKRNLIPEVRLSLHPDFALHEDIHMKAFNRFPLSEDEQKEFESEMRQATIGTLADWLSSNFKVMPDSFAQYPILKRLYHYAYKMITGEEVKEVFAAESFFHLIANGHVNGAKEFIKSFPEIVNHKDFKPLTLAYQALRNNRAEMLKFICEDLFKKNPQEFFETPNGFYKAVRIALTYGGSPDCLDYLLSNYDLKAVPESIVNTWLWYVNDDDNVEHIPAFLKYFPQHQSKLLKSIFEDYVSDEVLGKLIDSGISPQTLVGEFLARQQGARPPEYAVTPIFEMITKYQVDLTPFSAQAPLLLKSIFRVYVNEMQQNALFASGLSPQVILEEWAAAESRKKPPQVASNYNILEALAKHKVDLSSFSKSGNPFLKFILRDYVSEAQLDMLISYGINPYILAEEYMDIGDSKHPYWILQMIAKHKVDLSTPNSRTKTPLIFQIMSGLREIPCSDFIEYFYDQLPALIDLKDSDGKTLFDHAQMALQKKEKNFLLYQISPHGLWIRGNLKFTENYYEWCQDLRHAFSFKNKEKVAQLMQKVPDFIPESYYGLLEYEKEFPAETEVLKRKLAEIKAKLEPARKAINDNNFKEFYTLYMSAPEVIQHGIYHGELIASAELNLQPTSSAVAPAPGATSVSLDVNDPDWIQKAMDQFTNGQLDSQGLKDLVKAAPKLEDLRAFLGKFLESDDYELISEVLNRVYPDRNEFMSLTQTHENPNSYYSQHPLVFSADHKTAILAILDYIGPRLPELIFTIGSDKLEFLLGELSDDMAKDLIKRVPDIFTHVDEKNDFFRASIKYLPEETRKEFILAHKNKLKDLTKDSGIPYLFGLCEEKENYTTLANLIKEDPSLLEVKSIDGLTLGDLLKDVLGDKRSYKKIAKRVNK